MFVGVYKKALQITLGKITTAKWLNRQTSDRDAKVNNDNL